MEILHKLYFGNQKAIVGFVVSTILSALLIVGVAEDMTVKEAVQVLVTGLSTGVVVWFKRNVK